MMVVRSRMAGFIALLMYAMESPFAIGVSGQTKPEPPVPVFRSKSHMVMVPVIVRDRQGNHLSGLKASDFMVKENARPRNLAVCEEVASAGEITVPHRSIRDLAVVNNLEEPEKPERIVLLVIDTVNTPLSLQADARKQLLRNFADAFDGRTLVSLLLIERGGIKVVHDFTMNPAVLAASLRRFRGLTLEPGVSDQVDASDESQVENEIDELNSFADTGSSNAVAEQKRIAILTTIDAFEQIAQRVEGIPGRKSLIWVTAGFPFSISESDAAAGGRLSSGAGFDDIQPEYEHMWSLLNSANIAVYPLDIRGLENPMNLDATTGQRPNPENVLRRSVRHQDSLDTFRSFAEMTGGKAFFNTNDIGRSFREAAQDSSSYYMLGYYLAGDERPGWHSLRVTLRGHRGSVRARNGFFVGKDKSASRDQELTQALKSPLDFTGIPIVLRWHARIRQSNHGKTTLTFDVECPGTAFAIDSADRNHMSIDVLSVAKLPNGNVEDSRARKVDAHFSAENAEKIRHHGMQYAESLQLDSGNYTIRVVVRDNLTGTIGSVSAPVEIE